MIHARKWGWRRLAANLLLVPVLTGSSAAVAHAQFGPAAGGPGAGMPAGGTPAGRSAPPGKTGDAKAMLKEGRKALAAKQFDRAQDLARAAEASNPSGKWGLFDDTPNALLKDIQEAVVKAQKGQADQLTKQAKGLMARSAKSDAERAANLDQAMLMAQQAERLHGEPSAWDFGNRPDKLVKEIQTARGKLKNVPPTNMAVGPATAPGTVPLGLASLPPGQGPVMPTTASGAGQYNSTFQPAGGSAAVGIPARPAVGAGDSQKAVAVQMMTEGRKLADAGNFVAARAKYVEADKVGAAFAPNEYNPGFALQELNTRGAAAVERLVNEATSRMAAKDYVKADAALTGAQDVATALNLAPPQLTHARNQLRAASNGQFGGPAPAGLSAAGGAESLVPVGPGVPAAPGTASVGGTPAAPPANLSGRQLLDQAAVEFKNGDLDMAARLAQQAYNLGGVKDEAAGLLNTIDAERLTQKKMTAQRSFEAAEGAIKNKDYNYALNVLTLVDSKLLPPDAQAKKDELVAACRAELQKTAAVATAGGTQSDTPPGLPIPETPGTALPGVPGSSPPGTARVGSDAKPANPDSLASQVNALRRAETQKLRAEGLKVQEDATKAFGRGETDLAIQMLMDYANRVRAANLPPVDVTLLLRQVEARMEHFRVMKGQTDAVARQNKDSRDAKELIVGRGTAEEQRKAEVAALMRRYQDLVRRNEFGQAEKVAMQAKQLDPDNPAIGSLAHMAKMNRRVREVEQLKDSKENLVLNGLNGAEQVGPYVDTQDPVAIKMDAMLRARKRGSLDDSYLKSRTQAEVEIELKLDKPIPVEMSQVPLEMAIDNLRTISGLPISIDRASIEAEGISLQKPISEKLSPVATRHVLAIVLEQAGLSYVVENDVVRVTTTKKAKGRMVTKVFSVADLVTPIPNFAMPDYANFDKMIGGNALSSGRVHLQGLTGATPYAPPQGLNGGQTASNTSMATTPGISGGVPFGGGGTLETNKWSDAANPLGASAPVIGERNTKHEQLMKLITGMVKPYSWDGMGGPGRVEYFDIGSALVVNQTADVIREVEDLLEALRRLQDLAIAVEIRIISLSESWYERMGVDFSMNIKTHTSSFEPSLTQIDPNTGLAGVFRPIPYINDINQKGTTVGLTPAGTFTPDLDVPIRATSFNRAIPGFGGYPNAPGNNGGVSLGLAFLNDIQVYMFMEAAQGDRRINVMQAPKLTLFNGQTATLNVTDTQFFVTNVTVVGVNGQIVFIPNNTPLPGLAPSISIAIQAVVSADRRFVRLNLPITLAAEQGTTVPLFPITTFITPVFEGGSQGVPIPFTQFLQQPAFTTLNINTTVVCPDGGTVLMGGLKVLNEGRNEFGPPFLSKIPYINRLFKNVGIGRDTRHVMIMVTPRIIINAEEEIFQTEGRPPFAQP